MDLSGLRQSLAANPTLKLLRHPHGVFFMSFFQKVFKESHVLMIDSGIFEGQLAQYLENSGLEVADVPQFQGDPNHQAKSLVDFFCRDEIRFLRRFADEEGLVWVELTPWTERAFQWVQSLENENLVGTESRFEEILQRLDDLNARLDPSPEHAVLRLENKKQQINDLIRRINRSGQVTLWTDTQLEERLGSINRLSRELLGDFKQVEQNFKNLVKEIYEQQSHPDISRGDILGYTLDATTALRESSQGRSFYAFWENLISEGSGRNSLWGQIEELFSLLELRGFPVQDEVLRNLKTHLHQAGRKVLEGNRLLAEKLNKLLTEKDKLHREKIRQLLARVKDNMIRINQKPKDDWVWWIESDPQVNMIYDRPFSEPPTGRKSQKKPALVHQSLPEEDFELLTGQFHINTAFLRQRVATILEEKESIDLKSLLSLYPPEKGLSEVLAYFEIASLSPQGELLQEETQDLLVSSQLTLKGPKIIFKSKNKISQEIS